MSVLDGSINQQLVAALKANEKPELAKAFVGYWNDMANVWKDANNPHHRNDYVTLEALLNKLKPVAKKHGLAFPQFLGETADGQMKMTTLVVHESGQTWTFTSSFPLADAGKDKQSGKQRAPGPQQSASASSYLRRYVLLSLSGVTGTDEDDDGEAASDVEEDEEDNTDAIEELATSIRDFKKMRKESSEDALDRIKEKFEKKVRTMKDKKLTNLYIKKREELKAE